MLCGVQRVKEAWGLLGNPVHDDGTVEYMTAFDVFFAITLQTADHDGWIALSRYACTRPSLRNSPDCSLLSGNAAYSWPAQCAAMAAVASAGDAMYG
jgi:hypothetical protein